MNAKLRILILEDRPTDAELVLRELRRAGYEPEWKRVETESDYLAQLDQGWEIILADYNLPQFTGLRALELLKARGLDLPFIIVSGTIGEDKAVAAMKAGASDYLMKDKLARLGPAVERELRDAAERRGRKQAEEAMRASELRYRRLFESAKDGILILNARTGAVVDVNPYLIELLGFSREAFLGKQLWELGFFQDIGANQANLAELQDDEYIRYKDLPLKTADGRQIDVEFVSNVYQVNQHRVIQCNIRNISERKHAEAALRASEQEFRSLAEAMPQIVWVARPDGWNIYFNRQWVDYTGLKLEESYGHGWNIPFHPDDRQRAWDAWQHATQNDATYSVESRLRRADGAYRWWLIRGVPLRQANGEILKWFGTCTDIEDMKRAEEALRQQAKDLRARNETLTRFNRAAVGRELRMIELKHEVNELCRRLGEAPRHATSSPPGGNAPGAGPEPDPAAPGGGAR